MATNITATIAFSHARTNRHYGAALATLPGYTDMTQLRAALLTAQLELPGVPAAAPPQTADDIGEWLDAVAEIEQADRARTLKFTALTGQINQADRVIETIVIDGTDDLLAHLHGNALTPLMNRIATIVAKLRGADTAARAIDRNVSAEWKKLQPLAGQYTAIRTAQQWALGPETVSRYPDSPITDLTIANRDQIIPDVIPTVSFGGAPQPDTFWPDDETERLVWLINSGAQVWCPTTAELNRLHKERAAKLNQPDDHGSISRSTFATR